MRTIWKYSFPKPGATTLTLPEDSEFLAFATQGETPCAWFRVDSDLPAAPRGFEVVGTGHDVGAGKYLGTCQISGGALIYHLFEAPEDPQTIFVETTNGQRALRS